VGGRDKTRPQTQLETQRRPIVRTLGGAEVLVAVRGPSPGEGEGKIENYRDVNENAIDYMETLPITVAKQD